MTSEALVFDAPIQRMSLDEDLRLAGFRVLPDSKVKTHKYQVFRKEWGGRFGPAWIVLWLLDAITAFVFARAARVLVAFAALGGTTVMIGIWNPATNAGGWVLGASLVWLLIWGFMPRWRSIGYAAHVWHLGFTRSPSIPREITRIADRFTQAFPPAGETQIEVELFGTDPFLAAKRKTGLFGVETCYIAAWDTGIREFDNP